MTTEKFQILIIPFTYKMLNVTGNIQLKSTVTSLDIYENLLLVASADKKLRTFDMVAEKWCQEFEGHNLGVNQGIWDQFGEFVFSCSDDGTVKVWDKSGKNITTLIGHSDYVQTIALDLKNLMVLSGGSDCSVILWDIRSTQEINSFFHIHQETVTSLDFSEDSSVFLTGAYDGTVHLWDTMSLNSLKTCSFNRKTPISRAKFIGTYIYTSCLDSKILLWDAKEVKILPIKEFQGHLNEAYCCEVLAKKSGELFSGSEDGTVYLWDLQTAELTQKFEIFQKNRVLNTLDIDGEIIVASSFDQNDLGNCEIVIGKMGDSNI